MLQFNIFLARCRKITEITERMNEMVTSMYRIGYSTEENIEITS